MESRTEMSEVHGQEFLNNFDEEFDIDSSEEVEEVKPRLAVRVLSAIVHNKAVWYVAGLVDAMIVIYAAHSYGLL